MLSAAATGTPCSEGTASLVVQDWLGELCPRRPREPSSSLRPLGFRAPCSGRIREQKCWSALKLGLHRPLRWLWGACTGALHSTVTPVWHSKHRALSQCPCQLPSLPPSLLVVPSLLALQARGTRSAAVDDKDLHPHVGPSSKRPHLSPGGGLGGFEQLLSRPEL